MPRSDVSLVFDFFCRAEPLVEALVVRRELIIFLVKGLVLDAVLHYNISIAWFNQLAVGVLNKTNEDDMN